MANQMLSDEELRPTVRESWPIYQASVTWCAIFMGFVFSALLLFLSRPQALSVAEIAAVWFLVCAMVSLRGALILLQITAHQVIRYWQFFFPSSAALKLSRVIFTAGLMCMLFAIAMLLFNKELLILGGIVVLLGVGELALMVLAITKSHKDAPYVRAVGRRKGLTRR
jgi:hypothetical protein